MGKLVKAVRQWIELLGIPALIIAVLLVGVIVIAHEFFGEPVPLDAAIQRDLQNSEEAPSEPAAPSAKSSGASDEGVDR
jgi:hypothetical protein